MAIKEIVKFLFQYAKTKKGFCSIPMQMALKRPNLLQDQFGKTKIYRQSSQ
jgi:hypothetical protein